MAYLSVFLLTLCIKNRFTILSVFFEIAKGVIAFTATNILILPLEIVGRMAMSVGKPSLRRYVQLLGLFPNASILVQY